jgi:hypothetical protein
MGYDIHITRKESWFDEKNSNNIELAEWIKYVKGDTEMKLDGYAEATTGTDKVMYENAGLAVWTAYSKHRSGDNQSWFDFRNGNVTVNNPDQEIINKMIDIAGQLNAKVQGDDGETYDTKEEIQQRRPWWKVWK